MKYSVLFLMCLVLFGCDSSVVNSIQGQSQFTITNNLSINNELVDGVQISLDGQVIGTLNYNQNISKSISGNSTHLLSATSDKFTGQASISLVTKKGGGHAKLVLYHDVTGSNSVKIRCESGCGEL